MHSHQPPCTFKNNTAENKLRGWEWSDGGVGGRFGYIDKDGGFVETDEWLKVTHYAAPTPLVGYTGPVTITCKNIEDLDEATDPATGLTVRTYDDPGIPPEASDSSKLTVWEFEITKCGKDCLPGESSPLFTATIHPATDHKGNSMASTMTFKLSNCSTEPGCCLNAPVDISQPPYRDWDADLQFPDQTGFIISSSNPANPQRDKATTTTPVTSAQVGVECYDYGAYGTINAQAVIAGEQQWACEAGTRPHIIGTRIPLDADGDHFADKWEEQYGHRPANEDLENTPVGDGTQGDGFSRYEEYRGFFSMGSHVRIDPTQKDVFVFDNIGYGTGDYGQLGLTIHMVGQYERTTANVVNVHWETAHNHEQKCVFLWSDEGWHNVEYGHTFPDPPGVGTPNQMSHIVLYSYKIRYDGPPTHDWFTWDPADAAMLQTTIGHECGHYTNIPHHNWGSWCIMFIPAIWDPIPHVYCEDNPGCLKKFKLH